MFLPSLMLILWTEQGSDGYETCTRDAAYALLSCNRYTDQAYWVKATNKRDQLLEVLESFDIQVEAGSLLSRCAKCNGTFIPR